MNSLHDKTGDRKYLNPAERAAFYEAALRINDPNKRAFCLILFHTGCRISEALELRGKSIDESEGSLVFRTLKQRQKIRYRALPISNDLMKIVISCRQSETQRIWEFGRTTGYTTIKDCMKLAGLDGKKATPKGLRHGFAIACISKAIPLPTLQKWMGHARLETTAIYLDFIGDDERKLAQRVWAMTTSGKR